MTHPILFVSHGAPDTLLNARSAAELWARLGRELPRPRQVLAVSAHWESARPAVSFALAPETIHDFSGFARELYALRYVAPGAPALARRVVDLLAAAGIDAVRDATRGLDHGAWVPLLPMYPQADIAVTQLSVQPQAGPHWHLRLGEALRPLREEGTLILASGAVTHNFGWLSAPDAPARSEARAFADWLAAAIAHGDREQLAGYRRLAPHGAAAHPSEEHFLPLFVALGAADAGESVERLDAGFSYGGLAMDAYLWRGRAP